MSKLPVIIDCDPGHDDVIAITLALSSDKLDVRGIVTVMGNNTLDNVTKNALKALELLGKRYRLFSEAAPAAADTGLTVNVKVLEGEGR